MVGIPVRKSATRTYILVVYDILTPNEVRFVKFVLPDKYPNNTRWARHYGASYIDDFGSRILDCLPYEEYSEVDQIENEVKESEAEGVKFSFYPMDGGLPMDMKEVRKMLDAWNDEEPYHRVTYSLMLEAILERLDAQTKLIKQIKGVLNNETG